MTTYTYEFTAFTEAALLNAGSGNGSNLGYGDSFTMPASADTTFVVTDNDPYLSGDSWNNENANDSSYQTATITVDGEEAGNGGQVYGEQYFWVWGSSGQWYLMIEIEQEGSNDDYFTFYNAYGVPEEGETLTVSCGGNISCWQPHMGCLESPPATVPPVAMLDAITISEGESIGDSSDDAQLNILDNDFDTDGTITLTGVNGAQPGDVVTVTTEGGVSVDVTVDANGNLFFDTGSQFDGLTDGQSDSFELTYTITDNDGNEASSTVTVTIEGESTINAVDDEYTVFETESSVEVDGAASVQGNVLDNDTNDFGMVDAVLRVNGQEANVGEWINLDGGGRVRLMENGELDFDANDDFNFLAEGQTAMQNLTYTIAQMGEGSNDEYQCLFFGGHAAGTIIDDEYASNGVTISGFRSHDAGMTNPPNAVMIFDTSNPTGGDNDLASNTRGNVLIITEDFDGSDPDDEAHGGTFVFDFHREADIESLVMLDTEEPAPEIRLYDEAGNLITSIIGPVTTDGGEGIANINVAGVHRMEVELQGSGAIDNLIYTLKGEDVVVEEDTANVKINIIGVNDLEDGDEAATVGEDSGATVLAVNALDNTVDVDEGSNPVVTPIVNAAGSNGGLFSITAGGEITFDTAEGFNTLAEGETTTTSITYTVTDGQGGQVESSVTVTVVGVNDLADGDEMGSVFEDAAPTVLDNALANTMDPDSDPANIMIATLAGVALVAGAATAGGTNGGSFTFLEDGTVTFSTDGDFDALQPGQMTTTSIEYQVTDGDGGLVTSTYTVEVTGVNDAPVAVANSYAITEGEALTGANIITDPDQSADFGGEVDSDPNNDPLTINSALGKDDQGNLTVDIVSTDFVTVYTDGGVAVEVKLDAAGNLEVSENSDVGADGDQISLEYTVVDDPANGDAKVSNTANVTVAIADSPAASPEINIVFLLDASRSAIEGQSDFGSGGSKFENSDVNGDGQIGSHFDGSLTLMQSMIDKFALELGDNGGDVDIGVYAFEGENAEGTNALNDNGQTVFDLGTDYTSIINNYPIDAKFGTNEVPLQDSGNAFFAPAITAANSFFSVNTETGSDAINLVYVLTESLGSETPPINLVGALDTMFNGDPTDPDYGRPLVDTIYYADDGASTAPSNLALLEVFGAGPGDTLGDGIVNIVNEQPTVDNLLANIADPLTDLVDEALGVTDNLI